MNLKDIREGDGADLEYIEHIMEQYAISRRQAIFCCFYAQTFNQTKAARLTGYVNTGVEGARLMRHPGIRRFINDLYKTVLAEPEEILMQLSVTARADIGDYLDDKGDLDVEALRSASTLPIKKLKIRTTRDLNSDAIVRTVEIELDDRMRARELLGRTARLWADGLEKPRERTPIDQLSDAELAQAARNALTSGALTPDDVIGLEDNDDD